MAGGDVYRTTCIFLARLKSKDKGMLKGFARFHGIEFYGKNYGNAYLNAADFAPEITQRSFLIFERKINTHRIYYFSKLNNRSFDKNLLNTYEKKSTEKKRIFNCYLRGV